MRRFEGEVAIVTGAAGGIGQATAARFLSDGARILATDRDRDALAALADRLGPDVATEVADLADCASAPRITARAVAAFGRLDILVNNAGVGGSRPLAQSDDDALSRLVDVNLLATMRLTREALAYLPRPGGRVVNLASAFGEVGFAGTAAYSVAKAGVAQLTRQLTADYGPEGIRINAVAPGVIRTNMTAERIDSDPAYRRAMIEATPLGRVANPEEVAAVIAFLASSDASFIAGTVLPVDGGWLATKLAP